MSRGKKNQSGSQKTPRLAGEVVVDGSQGEGGGQILRSSLALSALGGHPLRLERIRAGRAKPGLAAQHLTCVLAAAEICGAALTGAALQNTELSFAPKRRPRPGRYSFNVGAQRQGGSAGAAALVLQTILVPLALSGAESELSFIGGSHVPFSPSFDFLDVAFLPLLRDLGLETEVELRRAGFYPVGGGRFNISVKPFKRLSPLELVRRGVLKRVVGRVTVAGLEPHVAARLEATAEELLAPLAVPVEVEIRTVEARSPGVALVLRPEYEQGYSAFSAVGERGRSAEKVAAEACQALLAHHASTAAVDLHLADQLLLPLAFASGPSRFTTAAATDHLRTNALVIEQFGVATVEIVTEGAAVLVTVTPRR